MSFNNKISIPNKNNQTTNTDSSPLLNHHRLNYFSDSSSPTLSDSTTLQNNNTSSQFILNVRFPHSSETHRCLLKSGLNTMVSELVQAIREQCLEKDQTLQRNENFSPSKSIIKLIHHGRLLTPPTFPISRFNIQPENFIQCSFSPIQQQQQILNSQTTNSTNNSDIRQGFDMLLNAGLAREEVNEVRRQFYASHSNLLELHRRGQLAQRDLYEIEQQWMQNDHVQTENEHNTSIRPTPNITDTNNTGNIYHFFCGVFLGFFLGFVSLIALLENSLPKRFQFGIRCGVTTMVLLSVFKYYFPTLLPYMM